VRYQNTVFGNLLKALPRRRFAAIVERHGGDKYVKGFSSWDHLVTLIFGQLGGLSSLREVETVWNAQAIHHYHVGSGPIRRSTLSDANRRRPSAIFAEVFAQLSTTAAGVLAREGQQVVRLIDATPIPLNSLHKWADWNGRTRGLKTHVIYDPEGDRPVHLEITAATVNDVVAGRRQPIEPGATYVFDKAYADYAWWQRLHAAGGRFVTRPKSNVPLRVLSQRPVSEDDRQSAAIESDSVVELASQQRLRLPIGLRRIVLRREDGRLLTVLSNDLERSAGAIAALYRKRWQIELLFRWIKQHLKIRTFSRPFRKRRPPADPGRHDRLSAAAHRRARQPLEPARIALCRPGAHAFVRTPLRCPPRQAAINRAAPFRCSKPAHFRLCLISPDSPARKREPRAPDA
jgi:putative transposase